MINKPLLLALYYYMFVNVAEPQPGRSDLVATRLSAAASLLELATLGAHMWAGAAVRHARGLSEVALRFARLDRTAKQDGSLAEWRAEGKLVKGDALAACFGDAR